ncbi:MAG: paraquat-inducible protein A [Gammaproteobacteria bacterium]|jgi:paraquat-inducible protein A
MASAGKPRALTARDAGLVACHVCGKLQHYAEETDCVRCGSELHQRKPESLQRSWAFLVCAMVLYIPANLYPILTTTTLGEPSYNTILEGVIELWRLESYPVAIIVFLASILIPIVKFLVIGSLLIMIQHGRGRRLGRQTRLFRFIEYIGPWSMIDVFVVILLVALIQFGGVASVYPGPAAAAFAGMVIATMLSALFFDTRLLWDSL